MIIDFHTHVFPVEICQGRECFFPDEPAFRLLYDNPRARLVGAAEVLAAMDEAGVDRAVIFGFPWHNPETARRNNDAVLEAVARHPDRLSGMCCVDAASAAAPAEVARCLAAGLAGVGELAFYTAGIDDAALSHLAPLMDQCRERGLPLMIHANEPVGHSYPGKAPMTLAQLYALVRCFPQNRIVLAHWGGGLFFYRLLRKEVKDALANVWFDTAASPFLYDPAIYPLAARIAGPERILFGSDFPLLPPGRYFKEMAESGLTETQRALICGDNARELLGL